MSAEQWHPLLPEDGPVEFPTMGAVTLRLRTRHDGYYNFAVVNEAGTLVGSWLFSPDPHIAICLRKTPEQARLDQGIFEDTFYKILGVEAHDELA